MQRYNLDIIGTHLEITVDTMDDCSHIFSEVGLRLSSFEARFSRFIIGNWLYILNTTRRWVLDSDTHNMLSYALELAEKTDWYFDPTIGKRLTELGYGNHDISYIVGWIDSERWFWDYRDIEISWNTVILHGDIQLEFGWVGKGYLIDVIQRYLEDFSRFLINFWWDMYGKGNWKIGLESPFIGDEVIGTYILDDAYLACSAPTRRKWGDYHHLIDPHTGESSRAVIASYIVWDSGMVADSYATALCVMPWERACRCLEKTPEISGVIVRFDGILFHKEGSTMELFS